MKSKVGQFWLVGCFGLNGPLRQDFSQYRQSPREREKEKRNGRRENKMSRMWLAEARSESFCNGVVGGGVFSGL